MKFRTGRENGRTIYVQKGEKPAKTDPQVATADTAELAALFVRGANRDLGGVGESLADLWFERHAGDWDHAERQRPLD